MEMLDHLNHFKEYFYTQLSRLNQMFTPYEIPHVRIERWWMTKNNCSKIEMRKFIHVFLSLINCVYVEELIIMSENIRFS